MIGERIKDQLDLWDEIGSKLNQFFDWIADLNSKIAVASIDLLGWCYEAISSIVLQIPPFIFTNDYFRENIMIFSGVSIGLVTIGFILNSVKLMFNRQQKADNFSDIVKRFAIVIVGMGFSPFILEKVFYYVSQLSRLITKLGYSGMSTSSDLPASTLSGLDTLAFIGFDVLLIGTLIPVALQNGRRYFDLFVLSALTPLALSSWIFTDTKKYFFMWYENIKDICIVQLTYALFITFIGLFIFLTRGTSSGWEAIFRIIIVAGGFWRMSHPPRFIKNLASTSEKGINEMLKGYRAMFTLKSLNLSTPAGWVKLAGKKLLR
ncbi:hypothetical protein [Halalkalibacter oceani]|uniref:hypothetical protein n=1 Tax=Halalkalibacter oceani TaxID=1653776 RepID=UPI00339A16EA